MRRYCVGFTSFVLLCLNACSTALPRPVPPDTQARREAAVSQRWIGVTKAWVFGCPAPDPRSGWKVTPLYKKDDDRKLAQRWSSRKAGLNRFCVFDSDGSADPSAKLPEAVTKRLRSVEHDRVVLAGSASLEELTWAPFSQRFESQVEIPALLPPESTPPRAGLTFLDSQPFGREIPREPPGPGEPHHGYTLVHLAGHLARSTGENSHALEIGSRLALPLTEFDPRSGTETRSERGGYRGSYNDLAQAILDEVDSWKLRRKPERLVLNLSVGWDGEKMDDWKSYKEMTPNAQAVYRALDFAADQGVLVLAAAGNELAGSPTTKPLLPAGWESLRRLRHPWWSWPWWPRNRERRQHPLVYAVSTRAQGEAPRVAYADHVAVPDFYEPSRPTATLTGSSVATAVVSTTAALVWNYRPELEPWEVMELLSESGDALRLPGPEEPPSYRRANFSAPSPHRELPPVRRISLCQALSGAVRADLCPPPVAMRSLEEELCPFMPHETAGTRLLPLPIRHHPNILDQPWIGPQPGEDPCPNCAMTRLPPDFTSVSPMTKSLASFGIPKETGPRLRVQIPDDWNAGDLREATLEVFGLGPDGRKVSRGACSFDTARLWRGLSLEAADCFSREAVPFFQQAILTFVLLDAGTARTVQSPLFLERDSTDARCPPKSAPSLVSSTRDEE
jgi:hypothetical protein